MRTAVCILLNSLVPGGGLILLRRERLGVSLALCFCAAGELAILGEWLLPASVPRWVTLPGLATACGVWIVAQALLWSRLRTLSDPGLAEQKSTLIQLAREAMGDGIYVNARVALESALALDDEDLAANVLWARWLMTMGRFPDARRAWLRVEQLDRHDEYSRESMAALRQLPSEK
jgi:hypothetical protein